MSVLGSFDFDIEGMEIVVSGITGKFPKCENVDALKENLLSGVDLTTDCLPWTIDDDLFPKRMGRIRTFTEFDTGYFNILPRQADIACPMSRMLLEAAYEALFDAGVNPDLLRGRRCGVYIAACPSESGQAMFEEINTRSSPRGTLSVTQCVLSGRISYWLGITGPTIVLDTGCSTSLTALDLAVQDIRNNRCDSALVGGANMIGLPFLTRLMAHDGYLSKSGHCFSFDQAAEGFARAEGVTMVFLQKMESAKRFYCSIVATKTGCEGYKEKGMTCTSGVAQADFLRSCYKQVGLNPLKVNYVECHGPGTKAGDPEELYAINAVFNSNRSDPLTVGSLKANMGHCEPLAGLMSLTKIIIGMETEVMPGTLNFHSPNPEIPCLVDGHIKINNKNVPFDEEYSAVNSFGLGGSLAHAVISRNNKIKQVKTTNITIPWLILCSGRTEEAVKTIIDEVTSGKIDPELVGLLHGFFSSDVRNHMYRGFCVVDDSGLKSEIVSTYGGEKRPICFIFSGMGSQWLGMGNGLLKIKAFADTMSNIDKVLSNYKVDIYKILCEEEPGTFDYILNAFVGIIAVQICLVDVMKQLEIEPDFIIGQSLGELSSAYADGALTLEQTITAAYYRGLVSTNTVFIQGSMASVGKGFNELKYMVPTGVEIACHNGPSNCVISGRKAEVNSFCHFLEEQKVFVKKIPWASGIPYHSTYLGPAGTKFLNHLKMVITHPIKRSSKWISSSVPEDDWDSDLASYSSAEYHCNNFTSPVLFEEAIKKLPKNTITIEVAPYGLMESIIRQFEDKNLIHIPLCDKVKLSNVNYFFKAIGRLYVAGGQPQISSMYPHVSYPVSRGTRMLSPLVRWDHSENWFVPEYEDARKSGILNVKIDASAHETDHIFENHAHYPFSECLVHVWKVFTLINEADIKKIHVAFSDVVFQKPILMESVKQIKIEVTKHTGYFEVTGNNMLFISGKIRLSSPTEIYSASFKISDAKPHKDPLALSKRDFYKVLKLRGLAYGERFKKVNYLDTKLNLGEIEWSNDWASVIDCMVQIKMVNTHTHLIQKPTKFKNLYLNPVGFKKICNQSTIPVRLDEISDSIYCHGLQLEGIEFTCEDIRMKFKEPILEKFQFVPHELVNNTSQAEALLLCAHLAAENFQVPHMKILEIRPDGNATESFAPQLRQAFNNIPGVNVELSVFGISNIPKTQQIYNLSTEKSGKQHIVVCKLEKAHDFLQYIHPDGFLLLDAEVNAEICVSGFIVCVDHSWAGGRIVMMKKRRRKEQYIIIDLKNEKEYNWFQILQENENNQETLLLIGHEPTSGILGLAYTLIKEMGVNKIRAIFASEAMPTLTADSEVISKQLSLGLVINVLRGTEWGSFRHIPLQFKDEKFKQVILENERFFEGPLNRASEDDNEIVDVAYTAVRAEPFDLCGDFVIEYSGVRNGKSVMGFAIQSYGCHMSQVKVDPDLIWPIPVFWSKSDACAAPLPFCMALIVIQNFSQLSTGDTIFINSGDSAFGYALIAVALHLGIHVFASCSTRLAVNCLQVMVPKIERDYSFINGDSTLTRQILKNTHGRGVDAIINVADNLSIEQAKTLKMDGKVIMINNGCDLNTNWLPSKFAVIKCDFNTFLKDQANRKYLSKTLSKFLETSISAPTTTVLRTIGDTSAKSLSPDRDTYSVPVVDWQRQSEMMSKISQKEKCWFKSMHSYIILGGLGGFGLELIQWMSRRCATKFVISSRTGIRTGYQNHCIESLRSIGIQIIITTQNICKTEGCEEIIALAQSLGPVGGIFNLALDMEMGVLSAQNENMFKKMVETRFQSTKTFGSLTEAICPELQHFVTFSSFVAGHGNVGQVNYAYASARTDQLILCRVERNLPGKSIQWGPISDVGVLSEASSTGVPGTEFQSILSCLEVLDKLLLSEEGVVASTVFSETFTTSSVTLTPSKCIADMLGIKDRGFVAQSATLSDLGMDSILAVRIKEMLLKRFNLNLSIAEIRGLTFPDIKLMDNDNF